MFWVVQNNIFNENGYAELLHALERLGIQHQVVKIVPFIHTIEPDVFPPEGPVMVMGSYTMWEVARLKGWQPGSFTNDNFTFEKQLAHWGERMLNHDSWVGRFADAMPRVPRFFIRPVLDSKSFAGAVMDHLEFYDWKKAVLALDCYTTLTGDDLVQIAAVKPLVRESRLWVVDGKIVTASVYKVGSRVHSDPNVDPNVIQYGEECIAAWQPARAFCLDIFETEDNRLWVGEINTINAAGFYAANVQKLVAAIDSMEF
jgi:hypothetical protein